jgi:hypothetical protein
MEYWSRSLERLGNEILFPEGWWDGSILLIEHFDHKQHENAAFNEFSFLALFTYSVWSLIFMWIVLSGLTYWVLEKHHTDSDGAAEKGESEKPMGSIFLLSRAFVGHNEYEPNTVASQMIYFSWSSWSILVLSAYMANFASFLVASQQENYAVQSFDKGVELQLPICVVEGTVQHVFLQIRYPKLNLIPKITEQLGFNALKHGECCADVAT